MSGRNTKIIIDILLMIFVILSFVRWSGINGLIFHSVVGTVFAILVAVHLYLNRKWVAAVTKSIKDGKANKKLKQLYIVDMILIVVWGIAILSGFLAIPSFINNIESCMFGRIHAASSRIGGVVILIHIYQHLGQIRSYLRPKK